MILATVVQAKDGSCTVMEEDIVSGATRVSAKFPAHRIRMGEGENEVVRDMAKIRALVYATLIERMSRDKTLMDVRESEVESPIKL